MSQSEFVFEEGEAIDVGQHGDTDHLFHEGTPVPNSGQSTLVFESGIGLGGGVIIEDFERGDLSPYSGGVGSFGVTTNAISGTYSGVVGPLDQQNRDRMWSFPGDGLPKYFEQGETIRLEIIYTEQGVGTWDFEVNFGHTTGDPDNQHYYCEIDPTADSDFSVGKRTTGADDENFIQWDGTPYSNQILTWEITWSTGNTITSRLLDSGGTELVSLSYADSQYAGNVSFGWDINPQGQDIPSEAIRFDDARVVA